MEKYYLLNSNLLKFLNFLLNIKFIYHLMRKVNSDFVKEMYNNKL